MPPGPNAWPGRGLRQRLLVPDQSQAPELPNAELAKISDYGDAESMRKAIAGVDTRSLNARRR